MRKLILFFPGNISHHGNVLQSQRTAMVADKLGLDIIGQSGIPVSMSLQGVDEMLYPEITQLADQYNNIEMLKSTFSHSLLLSTVPHQQKLFETGYRHKFTTVNLQFFSEFYIPSDEYIACSYYLILGGDSYSYSKFMPFGLDTPDTATQPLKNKVAIRTSGNKVGIIMQPEGFQWFLKPFFRFQRDPFGKDSSTDNKEALEFFLDQIEKFAEGKILNQPEHGPAIIPLDLEAPYVGSFFGQEIWQLFFDGIKKRQLEGIFDTFSNNFPLYSGMAQPGVRPHRDLGSKWLKFENQLNYITELAQTPVNYHKIFYSLSSISDVFSTMHRQVVDMDRTQLFECVRPDGSRSPIYLGYDNDVISSAAIAMKYWRGEINSFQEAIENQLLTDDRHPNRLATRLADNLAIRLMEAV